jgi:hypothetical protein
MPAATRTPPFRFWLIVCGLCLVSLWGSFAQAPTTAVDLKTVKYRDLVEVVKAQRGKVLVVDVWAET